MEIKKVDFERILSDNVDFSFEDLDVNGDNVIDEKDKDLTKNTEVFNMITKLLNSNDTDDDVNLIDDFDYNAMKSGNTSAQCLDGNCQFTVPTKTANENAATSNLSNLASTNDCPDGNCSVSLPSTPTATENLSVLGSNIATNNSTALPTAGVQNPDGTSTTQTTNAKGQTVETTYDTSGKKVSSQTTDKDGNIVSSATYTYNDDGTYNAQIAYSDRTRTAKYNAEGKIVSYTDKYTDGKVYNATYKYNDSGSYTVTIKNKKNGAVTTKKYNSSGKITSSITKNKKGKTTTKVTYNYNADGSYKKTTQQYKWSAKVVTENYDKDGNKITKSASENNVITTANASNYKDSINQDGVSYVVFTRFDGKCGHCDFFKNNLDKISSALDGVANFISLDVSGEEDGKNLDNCQVCDEYMKKFKIKSTGLPMIVKFVNGKPTELVRSKLYNFTDTGANLYDKIVKDVKSSIGTTASNANTAANSASTTQSSQEANSATTNDKATTSTTTLDNLSKTNNNSSTVKTKQTAPTAVSSKTYKSKIAEKGVTYIVMSSTGCGSCQRLNKQLKKLMQQGKFQSSTILSMNLGKIGSAEDKIMWNYVKQFNAYHVRSDGSIYTEIPLILKLVDGVPTGFVSDISDVSDSQLIKQLS